MSSASLVAAGLRQRISDLVGTVPPPPFSIAMSVIGICNSKCTACNIWTLKSRRHEFETWEWDKVVSQLGPYVKFYTFTGGEPFMRQDLAELLFLPFKYGMPTYITLATNCLLPETIREQMDLFLRKLDGRKTDATIYCNLSVDGLGADHDRLRGVEGNFQKVLQTIGYLQELRSTTQARLKIGVHIVISRLNFNSMRGICDYFLSLDPIDSISCEIAEQRHELMTIEQDIVPTRDQFNEAVRALRTSLAKDKKLDSTVRILRESYYDFVDEWLETGRQPLPCFAGRASCQITASGKVVACGTRWVEEGLMGDLREAQYDFMRVWTSPRANDVRRSIRDHECSCPLSHGYYGTLACHPIRLASVALARIRQ